MRKRDRERIYKLRELAANIGNRLEDGFWYIERDSDIKGLNHIANAYRMTLQFMDEIEAVFKRADSDISYERKDHYAKH